MMPYPLPCLKKWVLAILPGTRVTPNVISLALMFIYRLRTLNPAVKGIAGSEYKLLTVALMLGNKCKLTPSLRTDLTTTRPVLDDNTYTSKVWAEVSGISLDDIRVMEIEFLGGMRYSLLAKEEEWAEWQIKLGKFKELPWTGIKATTTAAVTLVVANTTTVAFSYFITGYAKATL